MASIPTAILLLPYFTVLFFFGLFSLINVWHLVAHGATTWFSFLVTFTFLAGAAFVLFFTNQTLQGVSWGNPLLTDLSSYLSL